MDPQKTALVTGGMGEVGEAVCQRLHQDGFKVAVIHSPRNDNAQLWLEDQASAGFLFQACQIDVADFDSCAAGVRNLLDRLGRIDVLVNNAGILRDAPLSSLKGDKWALVQRTDLDSVFNMCKPVVDGMAERGWGRIINISSVDAQQGAPGRTAYAAAKAGVHGFTKSLALEVASKGITVNTISPGYLQTRCLRRTAGDIIEKKILPSIPVGRLGAPSEVAALVAYLCSDVASFLTGANIPINGGQHMS